MSSPNASSFYARHRLTLSVLGVSALLGVVLPACEMPPAEPEVPPADVATTLQLSSTPTEVVGGQSITLAATVVDTAGAPVGATVRWTLSNGDPTVATVDSVSGVLTAAVVQSAASTTVQLTARASVPDGYEAPAPVQTTVTVRTRVTGVQASPSSLALEVGETGLVTAQAALAAGAVSQPAPRITWASSAPATVSVDSTGKVTAHQTTGAGGVTLTAATEGRTSNAVVVTVTAPPPVISVAPSSLSLQAGAQGSLSATVANAVTGGVLTWTSRDAQVASVTAQGAAATVHGVAAGSAWVVAAYAAAGLTVRDSALVTVTSAPDPVTVVSTPDSLFTLKRLAAGGVERFSDVVYAGDHEENGDGSLQGFARFVFQGVPAGRTIHSATLTLHFGGGEFDTVNTPFSLETLYVERDTTGALNEGSTGSATGARAVASAFPTPVDASFTVDVSDLVRAALDAGEGVVRLRFRFAKLTGGDGRTDYLRVVPEQIQLTYQP